MFQNKEDKFKGASVAARSRARKSFFRKMRQFKKLNQTSSSCQAPAETASKFPKAEAQVEKVSQQIYAMSLPSW